MVDSTTVSANEKEKHMKQMKRQMECWREIILPLNSILMWEQSWYPGLIIGITTSIFLLIWFLEPTVLTVIAVCLLLLALGDYLGPILIQTLCSSNSWNGQKERKLDDIVRNVYNIYDKLRTMWTTALWARSNHASMYCGVLTTVFFVLALIGNAVNDLLLLYIIVNTILLLPGLDHNVNIEHPFAFICNYFSHRKSS